jgi:hypothetical protein
VRFALCERHRQLGVPGAKVPEYKWQQPASGGGERRDRERAGDRPAAGGEVSLDPLHMGEKLAGVFGE